MIVPNFQLIFVFFFVQKDNVIPKAFVLVLSLHLTSFVHYTLAHKKGDKLWLEIENEVMSERSTPNIYNLWLFYNFSKSCKKRGELWKWVKWTLEMLEFLYFGLVPNSPLQTARDAVGRWKMERGDVYFHKFTLMTDERTIWKDRLVAPSLTSALLSELRTLYTAFLKFFQKLKPIILILSLLNYFSRLDLNFPVKYRAAFTLDSNNVEICQKMGKSVSHKPFPMWPPMDLFSVLSIRESAPSEKSCNFYIYWHTSRDDCDFGAVVSLLLID